MTDRVALPRRKTTSTLWWPSDPLDQELARLALVLAAAGVQYPPDPAWPTRDVAAEVALLLALNEFRGQNSLGPLVLDEHLSAAAGWKARNTAFYLYLDHNDQHPTRPWYERVYDNGWGHEYGFGENGAYSYGSNGHDSSTFDARAVVNAWTGDSGHLGNMLNPSWTVVGTGVAWSRPLTAGDGSPIPPLPWSWQDYGAGPVPPPTPVPSPAVLDRWMTEVWPKIQATSQYAKWAAATSAQGRADAQAWLSYLANPRGPVPAMRTPYGKALVADLHLAASVG